MDTGSMPMARVTSVPIVCPSRSVRSQRTSSRAWGLDKVDQNLKAHLLSFLAKPFPLFYVILRPTLGLKRCVCGGGHPTPALLTRSSLYQVIGMTPGGE